MRVAAADVNGDGFADIITGQAPVADRTCRRSASPTERSSTSQAFTPTIRCGATSTRSTVNPVHCDGVYVGSADLTGDGLRRSSRAPTARAALRVFQIGPGGISELLNFFPYFSLSGPVCARRSNPVLIGGSLTASMAMDGLCTPPFLFIDTQQAQSYSPVTTSKADR